MNILLPIMDIVLRSGVNILHISHIRKYASSSTRWHCSRHFCIRTLCLRKNATNSTRGNTPAIFISCIRNNASHSTRRPIPAIFLYAHSAYAKTPL